MKSMKIRKTSTSGKTNKLEEKLKLNTFNVFCALLKNLNLTPWKVYLLIAVEFIQFMSFSFDPSVRFIFKSHIACLSMARCLRDPICVICTLDFQHQALGDLRECWLQYLSYHSLHDDRACLPYLHRFHLCFLRC